MRSDLSEARSVMVEEASEWSRKRKRGTERGWRKVLVSLGQEGWGRLHLSHAAGRRRGSLMNLARSKTILKKELRAEGRLLDGGIDGGTGAVQTA